MSDQGRTTLDIRPSPRLLQVLGDIPLQTWQCLAELIDNSLDNLVLQKTRSADNPLNISINLEESGSHQYLVIQDDGIGMTLDELEKSLRAGHSSKGRYGTLGLFGMGFNIATARLGDTTTVITSTAGSSELLSVTIDFADLQERESYRVPVTRQPCAPEFTGTIVRTKLKRTVRDELLRKTSKQNILRHLGSVYSFLLRTAVPGISKPGFSSPVPAILTFDGERVEPKLPCIWSDSRKVTRGGVDVPAVQYIEVKLTDATACLRCGYWDRKNGPEFCDECGSANLEMRERRIWGWLGIQRYIDSKSFGIDFIRYGRKILTDDKSIFTYQDPDTLQSELEYPIEMPANQGRIVGEIHLDHVPVTYQKNDFDRQCRDWQKAIEEIRGTSPIKPRGAVNNSPLARLFSAFRRNDPGLNYLTPGDGEKAIHGKAREWAAQFDKGVARFHTDDEWYEAAERHQKINNGDISGPEASSSAQGGGAVAALLGGGASTANATTTRVPVQKPVSQQSHLDRARLTGTRREDLSGTYNLGRGLGSWAISVVTTPQRLEDPQGGQVPAVTGTTTGSAIEVLVSEDHPIFREFGRDVRDVALLQASEIIKAYTNSSLSAVAVYGELVQQISDLRATEATISDRINRVFERVRELMFPVVATDPSSYWDILTAADKNAVETAAAVAVSMSPFSELVEDGSFIYQVAPEGLLRLVHAKPDSFFDGRVFKPGLKNRPDDARKRIIESIARSLAGLSDFQLDRLLRQKHDIDLAILNLDHLESQLSSEEFQE